MPIDLNCDLGEGCPFDAELMPLITSANIACGFHAGDTATMYATLGAAARHGVQVGAHPGFPDREGFGRRELVRSEAQVLSDCLYQIAMLTGLAMAVELPLRYVKPHGALYNMACRDDAYARPVITAAESFRLPLMGLPDSRLQALSAGRVPFIAEGFADRRYLPDGSLVPRSRPDAFIEDPEEAVRQAEWLLREKGVQTLCVHGDNPQALAFVRKLREELAPRHRGPTIRRALIHRFALALPFCHASAYPLLFPRVSRARKIMIRTIVFDFGNVIGFFDYRITLDRLASHTTLSIELMHRFLYCGELEDIFESGRISSAEFLRRVREGCRLSCSDEVLALAYADMFRPNDAVCGLVPRLRPHYRLLLGSNTNDLHSRYFLQQFARTMRHFDGLVLSHEVGARKPRPEFFRHAQRLADCAAEECLFIDDLPANVEGARALGWQGIVYSRDTDLPAEFGRLGVRLATARG